MDLLRFGLIQFTWPFDDTSKQVRIQDFPGTILVELLRPHQHPVT